MDWRPERPGTRTCSAGNAMAHYGVVDPRSVVNDRRQLPKQLCNSRPGTSERTSAGNGSLWHSACMTVLWILGINPAMLWCAEMCSKCYSEQLQAEYLAQMFFEDGTVYVSKVAEVDRTIAHGGDTAASAPTPTSVPSSSSAACNADDFIMVTDDQVFRLLQKSALSCHCRGWFLLFLLLAWIASDHLGDIPAGQQSVDRETFDDCAAEFRVRVRISVGFRNFYFYCQLDCCLAPVLFIWLKSLSSSS